MEPCNSDIGKIGVATYLSATTVAVAIVIAATTAAASSAVATKQ